MKLKFDNYNSGYRVVSIAKKENVKRDLENDKLDFLYLLGESVILFPDCIELLIDGKMYHVLNSYSDYDVCEIGEDGTVYRCYNDAILDNYFFVTGKCNSNCIMCPSPEYSRRNGEIRAVDDLIEIAKHIPTDTCHLTITGGEPFVIGETIFDFFSFLREKFTNTEFLVLTNGRAFAIDGYVDKMYSTIPCNTIFGIPIHGGTEGIHDKITNVSGSYLQTVTAVKKLLHMGVRIELRIVVNKINIDDFGNITDVIVKEFSGVEHVSVMAMEMTGSAFMNRDEVWIPYRLTFEKIAPAIMRMLSNGINVKLYNFPLCTVQERFWTLCEKSISPNKIRYGEICEKCSVWDACGGVFAGTYNFEKDELEARI